MTLEELKKLTSQAQPRPTFSLEQLDGFKMIDEQNRKAQQVARSGDPLAKVVGAEPTGVGGFAGLGEDLTQRAKTILEAGADVQTGKRTFGEGVLRTAGQVAGGLTDVIARGAVGLGKFLLPKRAEEAIESGVRAVVESEPAQAATTAYRTFREKNPRLAESIESIAEIAQFLPVEKAVVTAAKPVIRGFERAGQTIKNSLIPAEKVDDIVGRITQGTADQITKARSALRTLDTSQIQTYSDLRSAAEDTISVLASKQDDIFAGFTDKYTLDALGKSVQVGEDLVEKNFVRQGIDDLKRFYAETNNIDDLARVTALEKKATGEGLTLAEINQLARDYNADIAGKAFSKVTGEPLTSINKVASENTRRGIKDAVRDLLPDNATKLLDEGISDLYTLRHAAEKMEGAVQRLRNRVEQRSLVQKVARATGRAVDLASLGFARSFIASLLPSNIGLKTLNALDLEKNLTKELRRLESLLKKGTDDEVVKYVSQIIRGQRPLNQ